MVEIIKKVFFGFLINKTKLTCIQFFLLETWNSMILDLLGFFSSFCHKNSLVIYGDEKIYKLEASIAVFQPFYHVKHGSSRQRLSLNSSITFDKLTANGQVMLSVSF